MIHRKALEIRQHLLGDDHPDTAKGYGNLASVLHAQGKYGEAEILFRKALEIHQRRLGDEHPDTAKGYSSLASFLHAQGKYSEAETIHRKALEIYQRLLGDDHPDTARSYDNLALVLHDQGKYGEAEMIHRKALEIRQRLLGDDHPDTARSYNNLANDLYAQGKYGEAEILYRKALEIDQRRLGDDHPATATGYNNLANVLHAQGKYGEAETIHRKALEIYQRLLGGDHPDTANSYNNLASVLHAQGKYGEAETIHRKALEIYQRRLGDEHPDTARSYNNLAGVLQDQGKYNEAEIEFLNAARILEAVRLRVHFSGMDRAGFLSGYSPFIPLSAIEARNGKNSSAWSHFESSLARGLLDALSERALRPLTDGERKSLDELLARLQNLEERISRLSGNQKPENSQDELEKLKKENQSAQAELSQLQKDLEDRYGPAAGKVYDLASIQKYISEDTALLGWVDVKGQPKAADPGGEHWAILLRHAGDPACVKLPGSGESGSWTAADDELPEKIRSLIAQRPSEREKEASTEALLKLLGRLHRQRLEPVEQFLSGEGKIPPVRNLVILPAGRMAGIPIEALADKYLVSYAPSATMFAHLLEKKKDSKDSEKGLGSLLALGDPVFKKPEDEKEAPPPPPDHGALVLQVQAGSNAEQNGLKRGDVILGYGGEKLEGRDGLGPAMKRIEGEKTRSAEKVPVKIWRGGEALDLAVNPGKLGVLLSQEKAGEKILKDREFEAFLRHSEGSYFPALPATRAEVEALSRLFQKHGKATLLLGPEASERRVQELAASGKLSEYQYLHFATHAVMDNRLAMQSALILSQSDGEDPVKAVLSGELVYDGKLTAVQIARTWKLAAELVTLSACETGLGKLAGGEGYLGFSQALFLSGARSVVLSLWKVEDRATAILMERFYENLVVRKLPKAEALFEAKKWLRGLSRNEVQEKLKGLDSVRGKPVPVDRSEASLPEKPFQDPYFWAGFILIGNRY
ncbi:MAG: tetratricopeptide repeat protein [Planctomycetes bacterium]|nr:tetratricopeptide repeat protein [Planctomycetota bacterium]